MKKIFRIISTIAFIFTFTSCEDFLVERPKDRYVIDNFFSSPSDAKAAVNGIYAKLYDIHIRIMFFLQELPADDGKNGIGMSDGNTQDIEYLRHTAINPFVEQMWQHCYSGIARANPAILNISNVIMEESLKNAYIGEARFLRALFYFHLVRFFGDVPVVLQNESIQDAMVPRTAKEEVYNQIIEDLQFAEVHLPISSEAGRATKGAAKILLGKVYLTKHDYQNSANKLAEVVENESAYGYDLHDNFGDNWELATENGKEMVFSLELMEPPGRSNNQMQICGPKYSINNGTGVPGLNPSNESLIPTVDLYNQFEDSDERKDVTFKLDYLSPTTGLTYTSSIPLFGKYWEEGEIVPNRSDVNIHIIRYADALLMYAEALNEINDPKALNNLNRVRERAFNNSDNNYIAPTQEEFRDAVLQERRLEFAHEGHRWFDLVRTGKFVEVMQAHGMEEASLAESNKTEITNSVKEHHTLFPIPQREVDLNDLLEQNPVY